MSNIGPMLLIGSVTFVVACVIVFIIVLAVRRSGGKKALDELAATGALDMTNKARIAVYSSLEQVDGHSLEQYPQVVGRKKSAFMDATMVLIPAGQHTFTISSAQTGAGDELTAIVEAGHTYQIGANDGGNYVVLDDADYAYKRALKPRPTVSAGVLNQ